MEAILKPVQAEAGRVVDGMYPDELQIGGQAGEQSSSGVQEKSPMRREVSSTTLERMSLESLLYHVLVGDGRRLKQTGRT